MDKIASARIKNAKKQLEGFLQIFIPLFIAALIWVNWGSLRDVFDYKAVYSEAVYALKTKLKSGIVTISTPSIDLTPTGGAQAQAISPDNASGQAISPETHSLTLNVPKIDITAPLQLAKSSDTAYIQNLLKQGVVAYPGYVLPGENGTMIILGHSAPPGWRRIKGKYDWIFSDLNELKIGDKIEISGSNKNFSYSVTKKFFVAKGADVPIVSISGSKSIILLITCWPPGVNQRRIIIQAELIQ